MLGFDVSIYYLDDQGKRQSLAGWSAYGLDWIDELVAQNRAVLVQDSGGYPYAYELTAEEVLPMLSPSARAALDQRISRKAWPTGEWNTPGGGTIHEKSLAACPKNAILTVEAWDQS